MKKLLLILLCWNALSGNAQTALHSISKSSLENSAILQQQIASETRPLSRGSAIKTRLKGFSYQQYGATLAFDSGILFYAPGRGGTDSLLFKDYDRYPTKNALSSYLYPDGIFTDSAQAWLLNGGYNLVRNYSEKYAYDAHGRKTDDYVLYPQTSNNECKHYLARYDNNGNIITQETDRSPVGMCGNFAPMQVETRWYDSGNKLVKDSTWLDDGTHAVNIINTNGPNNTEEKLIGKWVNGIFKIDFKIESGANKGYWFDGRQSPPTWDTFEIEERIFDSQNRFTNYKKYLRNSTTRNFYLIENTIYSYTGNFKRPVLVVDSNTYYNGVYSLISKNIYHLNAIGMYDSVEHINPSIVPGNPGDRDRVIVYYRPDGLVDFYNIFLYNTTTNTYPSGPDNTTRYYYESYNTADAISNIASTGQKLLAYPNPARNMLYLNAEDVRYLKISSYTGQIFYQGKGIKAVNIAEYPTGFYMLQSIDKDGHSYVQKFSKE